MMIDYKVKQQLIQQITNFANNVDELAKDLRYLDVHQVKLPTTKDKILIDINKSQSPHSTAYEYFKNIKNYFKNLFMNINKEKLQKLYNQLNEYNLKHLNGQLQIDVQYTETPHTYTIRNPMKDREKFDDEIEKLLFDKSQVDDWQHEYSKKFDNMISYWSSRKDIATNIILHQGLKNIHYQLQSGGLKLTLNNHSEKTLNQWENIINKPDLMKSTKTFWFAKILKELLVLIQNARLEEIVLKKFVEISQNNYKITEFVDGSNKVKISINGKSKIMEFGKGYFNSIKEWRQKYKTDVIDQITTTKIDIFELVKKIKKDNDMWRDFYTKLVHDLEQILLK